MEACNPKQVGFDKGLTDPIKIKAAETYNAAADHCNKVSFWDWYGRRGGCALIGHRERIPLGRRGPICQQDRRFADP